MQICIFPTQTRDGINQTILYSRKKRFITMPVFSSVYALRTISTDVLLMIYLRSCRQLGVFVKPTKIFAEKQDSTNKQTSRRRR